MALYNDLPGIQLTVKDGNLVLPREADLNGTVLILGPVSDSLAANGGTQVARLIRVNESEDFARRNLGEFDKTNPLARAWKQVRDTGTTAIYCLPVYGTTSEEIYRNLHFLFSNMEEQVEADVVLIAGIYADEELDTDSIDLTGTFREDYAAGGRIAQKLVDVKSEEIESYVHEDGYVIKKPVADGRKLKVTVGSAPDTVSPDDYYYEPDTRKIFFTDAYAKEEGFAELEHKITYKTYSYDFASQLAGFCALVSGKNYQTLGVISVKPMIVGFDDLAAINTYVRAQKKYNLNQYIQIVGGATLFFEIDNEPYYDTFAAAYAGLIAYLPSYSATTNKPILGAITSAFNLSPNQIKQLVNKHQVVPRLKSNKLLVADGVTAADDKSDFVRLSTVRITNDAVSLIREIADPYIGEPNTLPRRNSLETGIRTGLNGMINAGALTDFRFTIRASLADQIDGNMRISLDLVPAFETRRIFITVALKPALD